MVKDDDDEVPFELFECSTYSVWFALDWNYKAFRVSILFEGVSKVQYFQGGIGYYPFANEGKGNLLAMTVNQKNRWTPASYSGDPSTENPNAKFRETLMEKIKIIIGLHFLVGRRTLSSFEKCGYFYRFTNNWLKAACWSRRCYYQYRRIFMSGIK